MTGPSAPVPSAPVSTTGKPTDPGAAANGPPGSDTGPPARFASVLEDQVARTALAEGQRETGDSPAPRRSTTASTQSSADADPAANAPSVVSDLTGVIAALSVLARQMLAPTATASTTVAEQAAANPAPAGATTSFAVPAGVSPAAPATAAPSVMTNGPSIPPAATAPAPATGTPAASSTPTSAPQPTPVSPTTADRSAATPNPVAQQIAGAAASAGRTTPTADHDTPTPPPPTAAPTAASVAAPVAPTAPVPIAAAAAASSSAEPQTTGAALHQAIETVRMTIELGARNGYSQARIQLAPPELGEIRINLHQTADGLIAKVTSADGAAAQTLQQGGAELRRSLESAGVTLLRLDIGSSTQNGPSAGQPGFAGGAPNGGRSGGGEATDEDPAVLHAASEVETATTVALPNGTTIDVLA